MDKDQHDITMFPRNIKKDKSSSVKRSKSVINVLGHFDYLFVLTFIFLHYY